MKRDKISNNVIRRLPRYLRKLEELGENGVERVSSGELGKQMGLTPSQIRQDFSCFGEFGQQGYGYNVETLRDQISTILGMKRSFSVVIVGAGNLGHALIGNFEFVGHGFRLLAAFDISPELVGTAIAGVDILSMDALPDYVRENSVDIAVLTVSRENANRVARQLADCGVRAIWNFTNLELDVGESGILVEDIHFSDSLLTLGYYLGSV